MTQKDLDNTNLELRRGVITLAILSQLREEHYGYSLIKLLNEKGLEIDQGTVYPLLRRLQDNGLLDSEWNVEGSRPRRYYQISADGLKVLDALQIEWNKLVKVMKGMLS
ncbi:MAG: PadR family transcriptional regulator [Anaerolineales bacterium]|nr:PadR family transcriptional regulator [Anaerolineales bacterium]MCK5635454.1 PadR family transcriptional regulator [Anaerolineales bacterium]